MHQAPFYKNIAHFYEIRYDIGVLLCEKGFNAFAKSINSAQPAQFVQADIDENILLSVNLLLCERTNLTQDSVIC